MSQTRCKNLSNKELVADAVDGDDVPRRAGIRFDLLPQLGNVRIHGATERRAVVAPYGVEQLAARDGLTPALAEIPEDFELARREIDGPAGLLGARISPKSTTRSPICRMPRVAAFGSGAPEHRLDPRHQLEHAEGLGHVVIRTQLQAQNDL